MLVNGVNTLQLFQEFEIRLIVGILNARWYFKQVILPPRGSTLYGLCGGMSLIIEVSNSLTLFRITVLNFSVVIQILPL